MKHKKLFRSYHSFYTPNNSLYRNRQGQSSLEKGIIHTRPPLNDAPDNPCPYIIECNQEEREICFRNYEGCIVYMRTKVLTKLKPKTGIERFIDRYPNYQEMFIGSRK